MLRIFSRCAALLLLASSASSAADFNGWWGGKFGVQDSPQDIALALASDGKHLTGFIVSPFVEGALGEAKIAGDTLTFLVRTENAALSFKGRLNGGTLNLNMSVQGRELKGALTRLKDGETPPILGRMRPQMTERWEPVPKIVDPGPYPGMAAPPSDALVLFDGKDLSKWKSRDGSDAKWKVEDGVFTIVKGAGDISTRQKFGDYQLHVEWREPENIQGHGQGRGNSGLLLQDMSSDLKLPAYWYEVQILDSYNDTTYVNGQAGSLYKQSPPLVNAMRKPGEWNVYDVVYTAPRFNEDGSLFAPARVTVFHNGVLVQENYALRGHTAFIGHPAYLAPHGKASISLQDHGDPVSFRNIWIRER